jgi:hypothetical protein
LVLPAIAAAAAITAAASTAPTTAATATAAASTTAAAAAAAITTAATTAAATAAATTATLSLLRLVDAERAAVEHGAVHLGDCLLSFGVGAHGHEGEAAGLSGLAVGRDMDVAHFSEGCERGTHRVGRRVKRQIANVKTITHVLALDFVRGSEITRTLASNQPADWGGTAGTSALTGRSHIAR